MEIKMQNDNLGLYNRLGQVLTASGPEDAKTIIKIANLWSEGYVCE